MVNFNGGIDMASINEILKNNIDEYKKDGYVSYHQEKILWKITNCRTELMGRRFISCRDCGYEEISYCSCRNRHCPLCQTLEKEKWVDRRKADLINTQYFHVIFTVPDQVKMLVKSNEEKLYNLMFKCVKETILDIGKDPKYLGAKVGSMLILHTWTQKLDYHPHIHCLIPGGGLNANNNWVYCKKDYFAPVKALSKLFRGKFLDYIEKLHKDLDYPDNLKHLKSFSKFYDFKTQLYSESWYSYAKETFSSPEAVIEYLGRYTHKTGLTNNRIIKVTKKAVTFSYLDNKDKNTDGKGKKKQITLSINEFIRRFLLHILPRGYCKIRYIGILANRNKKTKLKVCQRATKFIKKIQTGVKEILLRITKGKIFICPFCKGTNFMLGKIEKPVQYCNLE